MVTQADIKKATLKGLGSFDNVLAANVPALKISFEPTLVISAGRIDRLGVDIRSFREPLTKVVKEIIIPSIGANFDAEGRPSWEKHSEGTIDIRERLGNPAGKILNSTGKLKKGAMQFNNWQIGKATAVMANLPARVWYGNIHQKGYEGKSMAARVVAAGGSKNKALHKAISDAISNGSRIHEAASIPARPFVMLQDEDRDAIAEKFIEWLGDRVRRAWPSVGGL